MSRLGLLCILVCIAVSAAQFGRPAARVRGIIRGRARGGFAGAQDCRQAFQITTNDQFCSTFVDQCGSFMDTPQSPQATTCASCIFVWMTDCSRNN